MAPQDDEAGDVDPDRKDRHELDGDGAVQELKEGDVYPSEMAEEKVDIEPVELPGHDCTSELQGTDARTEDVAEQTRTNPYEPK